MIDMLLPWEMARQTANKQCRSSPARAQITIDQSNQSSGQIVIQLALLHNFMNIDDPVGTTTMSDKSAQFNTAEIGERIKYR